MSVQIVIYNYVNRSGENLILTWMNGIGASPRAKINAWLYQLAETPITEWQNTKAAKNLTGENDRWEIRALVDKVQWRLIGFFGPDRGTFTILIGALKKGNKLDPASTIRIAHKNTGDAMYTNKQRESLDNLEDREYRRAFADELVGTGLAFQIRRLRETRAWTQAQLAEHTGKAQETISQWENPNYGRYSLSTLKELAAAFDVALLVKFVAFSELADWTIDVTPRRLTPPSYEEERQMSLAEAPGGSN